MFSIKLILKLESILKKRLENKLVQTYDLFYPAFELKLNLNKGHLASTRDYEWYAIN